MADKNLLAQMLENLVNNDQAKAEELFHEYVVAKSREIYEDLIESEIEDEDDKEVDEAADDEEAEEDKVDEASDDEEADEDKMDENFEDIAYEGDDEMGGDPTDDLEAELGDEEEMDDEEKSEDELFMDLESIVDELQAKFDELKGGDDMGGNDMGDNAMKDDFDLATVREYVEKVRPITYKWDKREWYPDGVRDGSKTDSNIRIGFIAQELREMMKQTDTNYLNLVYESNPDKLEATYQNLFIPSIKAIQELSSKLKSLESRVIILENK